MPGLERLRAIATFVFRALALLLADRPEFQ
jgi:hypothetical protein